MDIDYQSLSNTLISMLLKDYQEAETSHQKYKTIVKLSNLVVYESFPIEKIIELAERWNTNFYFLNKTINLSILKSDIENRIEIENKLKKGEM